MRINSGNAKANASQPRGIDPVTGNPLSALPSVDSLLSNPRCQTLLGLYGRQQVTLCIRQVLSDTRTQFDPEASTVPGPAPLLEQVADLLIQISEPSLRPVFNMSGTILHTNLGRALLPTEAVERVMLIASQPSNLEYDLDEAGRGQRDNHVADLLTELTGAEAATVVNNNAAAVLLVLNTLAEGKEVLVSRGELVEIGGSFRIPEVMAKAGCRLVEVGATNRTHLKDFERAIAPATGLLMKVHTSNYRIEGFTASVSAKDLAALAHTHGLPVAEDLGSGTLIDLTRYGLPMEPTARAAIESGVDLVTFSGDKLLGGPQAGIVIGKRALIDKLNSNPLKRALRVDKMTIAALAEVLKLYRNPDTLPERLPALKHLTRTPQETEELARSLVTPLASCLRDHASVEIKPCESQIGSGSLPTRVLQGYCIAITPKDRSERNLSMLVSAFRKLPWPVIGRVSDGHLLLDVRALDLPRQFEEQLHLLDLN